MRPQYVYRLYGLTVGANFPLHVERADPTAWPDVVFELTGAKTDSRERPSGEALVRQDLSPEHHATYTRQEDGAYLLRFSGACDFVVSPDTRRVRLHMVDGVDAALGAVLAQGTVLAFILMLRGECVLHASAVQRDGRAIGFVGRSGMGKSTLAALMCASGWELVSDDVLRVDLSTSPPKCAAGTTELRLRNAAAGIGHLFERSTPRRTTGDLRQALQVVSTVAQDLPLDALVVPQPRRDLGEVQVMRLSEKDALLTLLHFPRIPGVVDSRLLSDAFAQSAQIAERLPVYRADVPWGPPFPPLIADELASRLQGVGSR
jgi:hypothetical protein